MSALTIGDPIDSLPIDQSVPNTEELQILNNLFKQSSEIKKIFSGLKDVMFVGLLFIIMSLPIVIETLNKHVTVASGSVYSNILVRTAILCLLYFLVKNFYLIKK